MTADLPQLPPRPADGHKGTFGTVCVIGGQAAGPRVMLGGPAFTALGALRAGCGLAVFAVPRPLMASALVIAPSAIGLALPVDREKALRPSEVAELLDAHMASFRCLAVGPGFGADEPQQQIVMRLIAQDETPMVLDADALNAMAAVRDMHRDFRAPAVLTPHPGEFRRLAEALGIDADASDENGRQRGAAELAQRLGCVVALKGHRTVISDGLETLINGTGNVALATAGTGDVLTGVIASLIAQHYKPALGAGSRQVTAKQRGGLSLLDCARIGVHAHGLAADRWAEKHGDSGMTAMDLLEELPAALRELRAAPV